MGERGVPMRQKVKFTAKALAAIGAARFYHNGDGAGFVWRWWHPASWVLAPLAFVVSCIIQGAPDAWDSRHDIGFGMNPWFIANPDKLEWEQP